mgnify:CR=1 FL=1
MKYLKLVFAVGLVSIAPAIHAQVTEETCSEYGALAKMLMEARQAGVITLEAWDRPLMRTDEHKQRYITEFENKWFGSCMKVVVAREGAE